MLRPLDALGSFVLESEPTGDCERSESRRREKVGEVGITVVESKLPVGECLPGVYTPSESCPGLLKLFRELDRLGS